MECEYCGEYIYIESPAWDELIDADCKAMTKEQLLKYFDAPATPPANNPKESWSHPFFAMKETFSRIEVEAMSCGEIDNLLKLADRIADWVG